MHGRKHNHLPHGTIHLSLIFDSVHPAKQKEHPHQILECQKIKAQFNSMTIQRKKIESNKIMLILETLP